MSSTPPVIVNEADFPAWLTTVLAGLGEPRTSTLGDDKVEAGIGLLIQGVEQLRAWVLAYVGEADQRDLATSRGAVNTAALVRALSPHPLSGAEATAVVRLAKRVEDHDQTRVALTSGAVSVAAGKAVTAAVAALPSFVGPEVRQQAEEVLLEGAKIHPVENLMVMGKHILDVVDPDRVDGRLAARLEAEEAQARHRTFFDVHHDGEGLSHGRFNIPTLHATILETALQAYLNPALPDPVPTEAVRTLEVADPDTGELSTLTHTEELPTSERLGEALCRLLETLPVEQLPRTGGSALKIVVTIPLATLQGGLAVAAVHGIKIHRLSPGEARRLACTHGVIPMVLGSRSEVLDAGKHQRLYNDAQRTALIVQQHGRCGIRDCERPAIWGDAHHAIPWTVQQRSDLADGVILCPRHHTLAHTSHLTLRRHIDGGWTLQRNGKPRTAPRRKAA